MFLVNNPGPWQYYLTRPDNKGLSLIEIKNKYMREQLLFEQYISFQMQQQMILQQNISGGGDDTVNSFVENDYVENYFV